MKNFALIFFALVVNLPLFAQVELVKQKPQALNGKGKIYALIVGISDYDNIRDLNYAHQDAQDFYDFLVKESEFGVDSNNIRLLLNKNATSANVGKELLKLRNRMDEGSTFFIYFAGHGDANGEAQAFLLASDLPKIEDPSLYAFNGGVIHVYFLKDEIRKIISDKKSNVILVTDACRTNELAGSKEGAQTYANKIMEQNSGEVQFISCAADEKSEEGENWGQGRGVFSYFFMNGLRGLADTRPADGKVTVRELFDYVQKNVEEATAETDEAIVSVTGKPYRQSPQYCCTEKQNFSLVVVNEDLKQKTLAKMAMSAHEIRLATSKGRANRLELETNDSTLKSLYNNFYAALENKQLVKPAGQSAWDYYTAFKKRAGKNGPGLFDVTEDIKAALLNDAQTTINSFYSYSDKWGMSAKTKRDFYDEGVEKLRKARSLMAENDPLSPIVKLTRQCMEAAGIFASTQPADWKRGIKMMDSAIAISPKNPLPVYLKGRLLYNLGQYDSALVCLRKSEVMAPRWSMPRVGISDVYYELEQYDSVESILSGIIEEKPIAIVYFKLGFYLGEIKKDYENAVYYSLKAHTLAPEKTNILNNIGAYFDAMGEKDSALFYYEKAHSVDSNNAFTLNNIGKFYIEREDFAGAEKALLRAMAADTTEPAVYESLGKVNMLKSKNEKLSIGQRLKLLQTAAAYYEKAIGYEPTNRLYYVGKANAETEIDPAIGAATLARYLNYGKANADYYNELGLVYLNGRDTANAMKTFEKGITTDSNFYYPWYNLGIIYYEAGMWDSAFRYLGKANEINSTINFIQYKVTEAENEVATAREKIEKDKLKNELLLNYETDVEAARQLADMYYDTYRYDSAYYLYKRVLENSTPADEWIYINFVNCCGSYYYYGLDLDTPMNYLAKRAIEQNSYWLGSVFIQKVKENNKFERLPEAEQLFGIISQNSAAQPAELAEMAYGIALSYAKTENTDKTIEWLKKAFELGYSVNSVDYYEFEKLSEEKRYKKLLKKYK